MMAGPEILASAQAQFPKSANKRVLVLNAWHPDKTDLARPEPGGMDGWVPARGYATRAHVERLRSEGYTWVNLQSGGCANPLCDVLIARLI